MSGENVVEKFLGSVGLSTMRNYRRGLTLFCEWYQKPIETILGERKDDLTPRANESLVEGRQRADRYEKLIEEFHKWLITPQQDRDAYDINTARTYCLGILQIFRYYNMSITLRAQSPINVTVVSVGDFVLMPMHVKAMFHVAKDLRSKLLISIGNDLGWRIGDVLSIQKTELPDLEQQTPIVWTRITAKEKQVAKTCLSDTTVSLLKEYLFAFPSKNPYLFNSNGEGHIDDKTVNDRLRDLAKEANIDIGNMKLTWHCFRDMIISQSKNLGIDGDIIKLMVGKAVNKSMLPYLTGIDVKTAFNRLQEVTRINGSVIKEESKDIIAQLGKQVGDLSTRLEQQTKTLEEITKIVTESKADLESAKTDAQRALAQVLANKQEILNLLKEKERKS